MATRRLAVLLAAAVLGAIALTGSTAAANPVQVVDGLVTAFVPT